MTQPGELNRRLALQAPVEVDDGSGGVTRTYQTLTTLWAKVTPLANRADVAGTSLGAVVTHRIVIRRREGLSPRHRLQDGAHSYRIVAVQETSDRRFFEIHAEERED